MTLLNYYLFIGLTISFIVFYLIDKLPYDKIKKFMNGAKDSDKLIADVFTDKVKSRDTDIIPGIISTTIFWPLVLFGTLMTILGNLIKDKESD